MNLELGRYESVTNMTKTQTEIQISVQELEMIGISVDLSAK